MSGVGKDGSESGHIVGSTASEVKENPWVDPLLPGPLPLPHMSAPRHLVMWTAVAALAACSDPNALPRATISNAVDTVTVFALRGGPLQAPSAYSLSENRAVRTFETIAFDFVFTYDTLDRPALVPLDGLGLGPGLALEPGLLATPLEFDAITNAVRNGYGTTDTFPVAPGDRFYVRSRPVCSSLGGVPLYGKLEVLSSDTAAKSLTFRVLANNNCGYRNLEPGIPEN